MASTISGASLANIYNRLNNAPTYHPLDANTFADWSIEAGDIVTITRGANTRSAEGAESYQSPVMTSKMVWRGTPQIALNSSGNKEREAVSKISRRKYGRGAGMNNDVGIHSYVYNTESTIYSYIDQTATYITQGVEDVANQLGSAILQTASQIRSEVHAANSQLYSYVDQTATYISSHVEDVANDLGSEILQTASQIRSEVHASNSQLYSYVDQTATYISSHVEDVANDLGSEILQTASQIRSEVHASNSQLYSYVDQTATYINQVVANTASGLQSSINQQANKISLVVESTSSGNRIKTNQIVQSINDSGSETLISANKILLDGNTTVAGMLRVEDGDLFVNGGLVIASGEEISASYYRIGTSIRFPGPSSASQDIYFGRSDVENMIVDALVDGNTLKLWKRGDPAAEPSITFSKATSLSGTWSGATLTVTASPQGTEYTVGIGSQTANAKLAVDIDRNTALERITGTTNIRVPLHVYTPGTGQYDPAVDRWTGTAALDVSSVMEDKTGANKITSNGTYTPGTDYVGFSSVTVAVNPTVGSTFVKDGSTYYVSATKDGTEVTTARKQIALERSDTTVQITDGRGTARSNTPTYTIPLTTKSITSNGTHTPGTGYVGFSSVSVSVNPTVGSTFVKDGSTYYVSATKDGTEVTTARKQIALERSDTTVQITDGRGTARSNTPTYTIPLTTKSITSNGTHTPGTGYVGFSSVSVSVNPTVGSTFVKDGSTYYVSATKDGTEVTTARKQIALERSDTTVQITDGRGTARSNTPTYTIPLTTKSITSNGTYSPSSSYVGFSSVTVGVTPTLSDSWSNGTLTVSSSPSATANLVRTLAQGTTSWSGNTATVPINATYGSSGQYSQSTGKSIYVDASGRYTAGYNAGAGDCNFIDPNFNLRYGDMYSGKIYTSGSGGTYVRDVTGTASTGIKIPLSENGANALSANLTEIPDAGITANGNYKFKTGYAGIRYLKVAVQTESYTHLGVSGYWGWSCSIQTLGDEKHYTLSLTIPKNQTVTGLSNGSTYSNIYKKN